MRIASSALNEASISSSDSPLTNEAMKRRRAVGDVDLHVEAFFEVGDDLVEAFVHEEEPAPADDGAVGIRRHIEGFGRSRTLVELHQLARASW